MVKSAEHEPFFSVYKGSVESPFWASDQEIMKDLLAVLKAVSLKPVSLTKAGIPPKPLWAAINRLLIWKDPHSILYDWEEVDQVRFTYRLAEGLDLVRPDQDDWLVTGPGADQFFLADSYHRALLMRRAYFNLYDWDERCDARDAEGHRHNFGQVFRRDFVLDVTTLRETLWQSLRGMPPEGWVSTIEIAKWLTEKNPELLLSEVCDLPEVGSEGFDQEKLRFVNFWFSLLSRFGWADLARAPTNASSLRLCRLTPLGYALVHEHPLQDEPYGSFQLDDRLGLELLPETSQVSDAYLLWRLSQSEEFARNDAAKPQRLTRSNLQKAFQQGLDLDSAREWIEKHSAASIPDRLAAWFDEVLSERRSIRIVQNAVALDVTGVTPSEREWFSKQGFDCESHLVIAAGPNVPILFSILGGEPEEGFDYPPEEPYARWKSGPVLELLYTELPLHHRELLLQLGIGGEPLMVSFTRENMGAIVRKGWTLEALLSAIRPLTQKPVPARIKKQLEQLCEEIRGSREPCPSTERNNQ